MCHFYVVAKSFDCPVRQKQLVMKSLWIILVLIAGALLPLQAGFNARLGRSIAGPVHASMFSFIVGALTVAVYLLFSKEKLAWTEMRSASAIAWLGGGMIGAIFITSTMLALPKLGMALTFGLVVAGQMMTAVFLDHFGILVDEQHHFNLWRAAGVILIILGVIVVRRF